MSQLTDFPLFSQLPAELRLMVWEQFALPKEPLYYSIHGYAIFGSAGWPPYRLLPSPTPQYRIHPIESMTYVRDLAQVNKEARAIVLDNRKRCRLRYPYSQNSSPLYLIIDIPIDWERDVVLFGRDVVADPEYTPDPNPLYWPGFTESIQNMAIDIPIELDPDPTVFSDVSDYLHDVAETLHGDLYPCLGPNFESLRHLQLIIFCGNIQDLYDAHRSESPGRHSRLDGHFRFSNRFTGGFFPISSEKLHIALEPDPEQYPIADSWQQNTLLPLVDSFTKNVSSAVSDICGRNIDVDVIIRVDY